MRLCVSFYSNAPGVASARVEIGAPYPRRPLCTGCLGRPERSGQALPALKVLPAMHQEPATTMARRGMHVRDRVGFRRSTPPDAQEGCDTQGEGQPGCTG